MLKKILRIIAYVYLCSAVVFIGFGYLSTLFFNGWRAFLWLFNPFNIANFVVVVLTLVPGGLLLWWADKLPN